MHNPTRVAIAALVLALAAIWIFGALSEGAAAAVTSADEKPFGGDVIMMRCVTDGPRFAVTAFEGSSQAPGKKSDSCAEELSLLLRGGFTVRDVGHSDVDKKYVVVTLTR